jgi:hypothetical protein
MLKRTFIAGFVTFGLFSGSAMAHPQHALVDFRQTAQQGVQL